MDMNSRLFVHARAVIASRTFDRDFDWRIKPDGNRVAALWIDDLPLGFVGLFGLRMEGGIQVAQPVAARSNV